MKTLTCKQMGGTCDHPITAATPDEMMALGMAHLESAHPEMAAQVKSMAHDDPMMIAWMETFQKTWAETPEDPAAAETPEVAETPEIAA